MEPITATKSFDIDYDKTKQPLTDPSKNLNIPPQKPTEQTDSATYATEVIALPSKGLCYPIDNPLSNGKIEMKYMTSKEEDILLSQNLIQKGLVFDKLFQSLIVTQINYDDLLSGDKDAIMLAARILGYGPKYETTIDCPKCNTPQIYEFSLGEFKEKEVDESILSRNNEYEFTIPTTGKVIKFKFLTHADEKLIDNEKKQLKDMKAKLKIQIPKDEPSKDLSLRLKYIIIEVDGKRDKQYITKFIESFRSSDSLALRQHIYKISPGMDLGFEFVCNECDHRAVIDMPIDVSFFWPNVRI